MKPSSPKSLSAFATAALLAAGSARAAVYTQNFTFADNTSSLGDGTIIASNDGLASVQGGALRIANDAIGNETSVFKISGLGGASLGWTATFNVTITDTVGENPPADGFSLSWGNVPFNTSLPGVDGVSGFGAEHGWQLGTAGDHIAFEVDTWQNGATDNGVRIGSEIGGVHTHLAATQGVILNDGTTVSGLVTLSWSPLTGASMTTSGFITNAAFSNVAVPGFTGSDAYVFAFASRTGGADETVLIDNLTITTVPESSTSLFAGLAGFGLMTIRRRK